ncbi:MAG: two-component sensor histidine kinase, partial [Rhodobacterales bacterium]|nr:two-component sensor histidine kinase [Rhodobacterales bacterium]
MEGRDLAQSIRHPRVLEGADSVLEGGEERSVEISLPGQVSHTYAVHLAPIGGPASPGVPSTSDGSTVRAVVAIYDLTMVKKAEEMRADFVANVSHELRSPMAAVIGFIETLKGPARDDPAARDRFLDIMAREAARMTRLIDELLSLSRVQA